MNKRTWIKRILWAIFLLSILWFVYVIGDYLQDQISVKPFSTSFAVSGSADFTIDTIVLAMSCESIPFGIEPYWDTVSLDVPLQFHQENHLPIPLTLYQEHQNATIHISLSKLQTLHNSFAPLNNRSCSAKLRFNFFDPRTGLVSGFNIDTDKARGDLTNAIVSAMNGLVVKIDYTEGYCGQYPETGTKCFYHYTVRAGYARKSAFELCHFSNLTPNFPCVCGQASFMVVTPKEATWLNPIPTPKECL